MRQVATILAVVTILLAAVPAAQGVIPKIELGTGSGGLMIYYNNLDVSGASGNSDGVVSGYDENPSNQAYMQTQYGYSNTNGMAFQFSDADLGGGANWNDIFSGKPVGQSQFGLDIYVEAPSYDGSGGVSLPSIFFADNVDNTVAGATLTAVVPSAPMAWAINDYKNPSGPESGSIINSVLRGNEVTFTSVNVTLPGEGGTIYTLDVEGTLGSDGLIHWYNPAFGTTPLSSWKFSDTLYFSGTLTYDMNYSTQPWGTEGNTYGSGLENGSDQRDFYVGSIAVSVQPIPEPLTMAGVGIGLIGLGRYLRRRQVNRR
jgi:hypothetical protein